MYNRKLIYLRQENKLNQKQVADILSITKSGYCKYETEYDLIPLKYLITLANYYNVSIDYLFEFTTQKQYPNINFNLNLIFSGQRLKEVRKNNKLTQAQFAEKLNVARTIISKYEKGEYLISTHALYDICQKYKISADYLLGRI